MAPGHVRHALYVSPRRNKQLEWLGHNRWTGAFDFDALGFWGKALPFSTFEGVAVAHIVFSGLLMLAAIWHWTYWDLELWEDTRTGEAALDLPQIFGIHLTLAGVVCFGFGLGHCSSVGLWVSDPYGLTGHVEKVAPAWGADGFNPFSPGGIAANHIGAGLIGFIGGHFHMTNRPSERLYRNLRMGNIEGVLASALAATLFVSFVVSGTMWYGSATTPVELFGPTRYQWDSGYFNRNQSPCTNSY